MNKLFVTLAYPYWGQNLSQVPIRIVVQRPSNGLSFSRAGIFYKVCGGLLREADPESDFELILESVERELGCLWC